MAKGYAFDSSVREYDADGRLHIARSRISKATVNPYFGMEIPGYQELGLDAKEVYYLLRSPDELAAGASSFARNQILAKHIPVNADEPQKDVIAGTIGSNVEFVDPYLWADLCIWDATAIAGIETDTVRELSCAYHYVPIMTPGDYQGEHYDGIMTQIRGNHLALVESGRAGSDVLAADEAIKTMKTTKLGKALIVTLGGLSPKLAQDSALLALVGQAKKKTFNKIDVSAKLIAMDADLKPAAVTAVFDSLLAFDEEKEEKKDKPAEDEETEEEKKKKKVAEDEDDEEDEDEEKKKKKKVAEDQTGEEKAMRAQMKKDGMADVQNDSNIKHAMDSFKKDLRDADEARRAVRPVVGDVIAQDSAEEIYGFALDHLKVGREGVTGVPALKSLFTLAHSRSTAPVARIAQDSAGAAVRFPNAARFRQQ